MSTSASRCSPNWAFPQTAVITPKGNSHVLDIITDSLANFQLQGEIEWSAVAFALYLPPARAGSIDSEKSFASTTLRGS